MVRATAGSGDVLKKKCDAWLLLLLGVAYSRDPQLVKKKHAKSGALQ